MTEGYLRTAREAAPHMIAVRWGRIINVSGLAARQTGSIISSVRNVADELGPKGINVTFVYPGPDPHGKDRPQGRRPRRRLEAPLDDVAWMVGGALGGGRDSALQGLEERVARWGQADGDRSQVVMRGDEALAVVLWRIEAGVGLVEARVVHPKFRGGWSNVVLMEAGLTRARDEGVVRFRFHCDDTVRDTISLAKRCGAEETRGEANWYYPIAAADAAED